MTEQAIGRLSVLLRVQIGLAYFAFIVIGANDGALGVLNPSLRGHYGIDKATVGLVFLAGTCGYLVAAFGSGLLVEKLGQRVFLVLGASAFSIGALALVFTPPYTLVLATFLLMGFGVATIDAGLNSYIAGLPRNAALLNYLHAFYGTGALIGPLVAATILAVGLPWNSIYLVWLAFGAVMVAGFALAYTQRHPATEQEETGGGNVLAEALKLRVVWLGALFLLVYVGAEVSLGLWSYSFLTEERGEDLFLAGLMVSGYWLGLTVGRFVLGRFAERRGSKLLIQLCLAGTVAGVLLVWLVPGTIPSALGLWLAGFSLGPIFPSTIALTSEWVPPRLLPSAIGFLASFGAMGAALFPWLAGNLAEAVGLWSLLPYVVALIGLMFLFWWMLNAQELKVEG